MRNLKIYFFIFTLGLSLFSLYVSCEANHENSVILGSFRESSDLELKTLEILKENCDSCHGPEGSGDGGFSSVLDPVLMFNQGYIKPGKPNESSIFTEIEKGDMPISYNLNFEEIEVIRQWITEFNLDDELQEIEEGEFDLVFKTIIEPKCIQCHGSINTEVSLLNYIEVKDFLVAGFPQYSLLLEALIDSNIVGHNILESELGFLSDWIKGGANP